MRLKQSIVLVGALIFFGWIDIAQAGLGLSPSRWIENNAVPGAHIEKTFTLSRSDPAEDIFFKAEFEGEISDWISAGEELEFTMPKGHQQFPMIFTIDIPRNAEYKDYQGGIRLKSISKDKLSADVGVNLQALIQIDLTVTEREFVDYDILQIRIPRQKESEFLSVFLKIWNRGNVEARPTKLEATFWDKYKAEELATVEISDFSKVKAIQPFSQGEIEIEVPSGLEPNEYWARISVYDGDALLKSEDITFEILEKGVATYLGAMGEFFSKKYILIGLMGAFLLGGLVFGIKLYLRKKK